MKGNDKIIAHLNDTLVAEFTAIHQYFVHAEMQENWGYVKLSKFVKAQSIDEMRHAEKLIERILYLDGVPNMGTLKPMKIGQNVKEQFESDLALEIEAVDQLNGAVDSRKVIANDVAIEGFLAIVEGLNLIIGKLIAAQLANDVASSAAKSGSELSFGELEALFRKHLPPAMEVGRIRINEHPVDIENYGLFRQSISIPAILAFLLMSSMTLRPTSRSLAG